MIRTARELMSRPNKIKNSLHIGKSAYLQHKDGQYTISDKGKIQNISENTILELTHLKAGPRFYKIH